MAIYHLNAKIIGRKQGKSAVAAAAYRAATKLYSERQGIEFDFRKKHGVMFSEIIFPDNVPLWAKNREKLWNKIELFEKRKDATYAREIEVALPVELSLGEYKALLREYISESFVKLGMIADYAIHDINSKNPHAHIMLSLRSIDENGFGKKVRAWNDKRLFLTWREQWAEVTNKHLAIHGYDKKVSHLSHEARGIDLEPTMHRGYMSRDSKAVLDRYQEAKAIIARNYERLISNPVIAIDLLTQHESIFSHHDLARFVNERTNNVDEYNTLKTTIESSKELVLLGEGIDGQLYYTSQKVLIQERALISLAKQFASRSNHVLQSTKYKFILNEKNLTPEQIKAFNFIILGEDLSLIVGYAGTGKSYLLDTVREAYEAAGYRVIGTALSGRAADGLMTSASIPSKTIARFLLDWQNGREQLTKNTVLVIDEAGMVGTRQLLALLNEANKVRAKVICCGDPEQIPPIEAGCPFRFLLDRITPTKLTSVIRQQEEWQREATVELSTQQHHKAIDRYHDKGYVYEHQNREEARYQLVERWFAYREKNPAKSAIMMSYRNVDVLAMNLMARERLLQQGKLGRQPYKINTKLFGELDMVEGERIMFLRNENSLGIKNGILGTIQSIDKNSMTVALDRGGIVAFDNKNYQDIGYGYAATIHKLQGETVDQSFVLATPNFDRFLTNVALDRHREGVELHYGQDDFTTYENLKRTLSRGDSKILAVEFAQSRGIDYDEEWDKAAHIESKKDFSKYYEEILAYSIPAMNTEAEHYFRTLGLTKLPNSIRFNPSVWNKDLQDFAPAIVISAIGKGKDDNLITKGADVIFISNEIDNKKKSRYNGDPNSIIMLQKATKDDNRWFITDNIEIGLIIAEANNEVRVAYIPMLKTLSKLPMKLSRSNEIIFCTDKIDNFKLPKVLASSIKADMKVSIANPRNALSFREEYIKGGSKNVLRSLNKATEFRHISLENEIEI